MLDYHYLKARHRAEREGQHPNLALRLPRALSWLNRAEQMTGDADLRFILLWIAFNAAYATEIDERDRDLFLAAGAIGAGAIYTEHAAAIHILRMVILRIGSITNYLVLKLH